MDSVIIILLPICFIFLCGFLGYAVSSEMDKARGFWFGLLLGPIGVLIAALACRRTPPPVFYSHPSPVQNSYSTLSDAPSEITVRRDGHIIGTWPLADVLDFLTAGQLLPSDHYLQNPQTNTWRLLSRLQ